MESVQNFFKNLWDRIKAFVEKRPTLSGILGGSLLLLIISFFIPVPEPHVALSGEPIFSDGPSWLTNSLITTIVVDVVIILMAVIATARIKEAPSGWQNTMEAVVEALYNLSESVVGRDARRYFPWVATLFIFILISSWSGLIPGVGSIGFYHEEEPHIEDGGEESQEGEEADEEAFAFDRQLAMADGNLVLVEPASADASVVTQEEGEEAAAEEEHHAVFVPLFRAPSADLNMTFALAIATMVMVQIWGFRALGGGYVKKFFTFSGEGAMRYINAFVGVLELVSEFSRTIAFGFRLFGNIFAGEIILLTMAFLIPFLLPVPFYALELFVAVIQGLVFMMLALVFFNMATISHGHDEEH